MFQLDMMCLEKGQLADCVNHLSQANMELHKKKAAAKKEMEESKQEMDAEKRDLMNAVEVRRAGTALIQRDAKRAHTLMAKVEAMQIQKGEDEEEKKQLRRLNLQNIFMIQKYRLAIDRLSAKNEWNLDGLTEAQPNE